MIAWTHSWRLGLTMTDPEATQRLKAYRQKPPMPPAYINAAGSIQNLLEEPCGGVAVIRSRAGSVRSQHYHLTDAHWLYVLSGQMHYFERPVGSKETPEPILVQAGEMIYTPSMVEHATSFSEDTVLISMSKNPRTHEAHEADLVRVKVI